MDTLDQVTGKDKASPELNIVDETEVVGTISKSDFKEMWNYESNMIEDAEQKKYLLECFDFAYKKSGGLPYLGKKIGRYALENKSLPNYEEYISYFNELTTKLEKKDLFSLIAIVEHKNCNPSALLKESGIVYKKENGQWDIRIGFLKDYLSDQKLKVETDEQTKELQEKRKSFVKTIETINKDQRNKGKEYIFALVADSTSIYDNLAEPCYTSEQFSDFVLALFKVCYEWTKKTSNRERIPTSYRDTDFVKYVATARHAFAHTQENFVPTINQKTKVELLEYYLGSKNEPHKDSHFFKIQKGLLNDFDKWLKDILTHIQ